MRSDEQADTSGEDPIVHGDVDSDTTGATVDKRRVAGTQGKDGLASTPQSPPESGRAGRASERAEESGALAVETTDVGVWAHDDGEHTNEPSSVLERDPNLGPNEAKATGTIRVVAVGGYSDVYLGAQRLGSTPLDIELPTGKHLLRLYPFGKGPGDLQYVTVYANSEVTIRVHIRTEPQSPATPPGVASGSARSTSPLQRPNTLNSASDGVTTQRIVTDFE